MPAKEQAIRNIEDEYAMGNISTFEYIRRLNKINKYHDHATMQEIIRRR